MTAEITLHCGAVCLLDEEDLPAVQGFKWWAATGGRTRYAIAKVGGRSVPMHRLLMPDAAEIDHINGNGLDNRRANLRRCTRAQNAKNRRKNLGAKSRFKGVSPSASGTWRVSIEQDGERLELGTFDSEARAAAQYDRAARLFHGAYAKTNADLGLYTSADLYELSLPRAPQQDRPKTKKARWAKQMMNLGIVPRIAARA